MIHMVLLLEKYPILIFCRAYFYTSQYSTIPFWSHKTGSRHAVVLVVRFALGGTQFCHLDNTPPQVGLINPLYLNDTLQQHTKRIIKTWFFRHHMSLLVCTERGGSHVRTHFAQGVYLHMFLVQVAVKAITFPRGLNQIGRICSCE